MWNAGTVQEMIHQAAGYGFTVEGVTFDMAALKEKRDNYVKRLNGIYEGNLKNSGVTSIKGDAVFVGPKEIKVGDKTYSGDKVLIAVGGTCVAQRPRTTAPPHRLPTLNASPPSPPHPRRLTLAASASPALTHPSTLALTALTLTLLALTVTASTASTASTALTASPPHRLPPPSPPSPPSPRAQAHDARHPGHRARH